MTSLSRIFSLFPSFIFLLCILSFYLLIKISFCYGVLTLLFSLYLFPLLSFRLIGLISPIKEGTDDLLKKKFNTWWAAHQIQTIYYVFPFLENILKVVPGLFSLWLRLWGSRIGKNVYWTPNIIVNDRSLLDIADNVILGHRIEFLSHVITPKDSQLLLYVKKISIGPNAFIGAGSRFGPGVIIDENALLGVLTDGEVNQHFPTGNHIKKRKRST